MKSAISKWKQKISKIKIDISFEIDSNSHLQFDDIDSNDNDKKNDNHDDWQIHVVNFRIDWNHELICVKLVLEIV